MIIKRHEGNEFMSSVAVPTTLRKKYPQYFDKPGFSVDSRELMWGDV